MATPFFQAPCSGSARILLSSSETPVPAESRAGRQEKQEWPSQIANLVAVSANLLAQRRSEAVKLRADAGMKAVTLDQAKTDVLSLRAQAAATRRSVEALQALLPPPQSTGGTEVLADPARPGLVRFLSPMDGVVVARAALVGQGVMPAPRC